MLEDVNEMELKEVKDEEGTKEVKEDSFVKKGLTWAKKHFGTIVGVGSAIALGAYAVIKFIANNGSSEATEGFEVINESSEPAVESDIQSNDVQ